MTLFPLILLVVAATPPEVPGGFVVDHLKHAEDDEGSWVCMDFDPRGRIVIAPESGPLLRLTLQDNTIETERLKTPIERAQGLLHLKDSLYCNVNAPLSEGGGLHRLRDRDGDGDFEVHERLSEWEWGGEHGAHAIIEGPDGLLYLVQGNHVRPPENLEPTSALQHWQEDVLVERLWDPRGHAVGRLAPAGHVLRINPDGTHWELYAGGMRNAYDIAFNEDGELFAYDADMEWDIGTAWYRLPRVIHVVSGGETGWRSGSAKWSDVWPDTVPPVVETDVGSPTGICFAYETSFPEPWRSSLLLGDWSYGRILACQLEEDGGGYRGTILPFAQGRPFNVTDMTVGPDGHLYCITGGRGTESDLYRIRWIGAPTDSPSSENSSNEARTRRRSLEAFHGKSHPEALDAIWSGMGDDDRSIRYAGRIALERLPSDMWAQRAIEEDVPTTTISALLALARVGTPAQRSAVLARVRMLLSEAPRMHRVALLRIAMIALARGGEDDELTEVVARGYPDLDGDFEADRVASIILCYLQHPAFVRSTLDRIQETSDPAHQLHFALMLRLAEHGWNEETLGEFRQWHGVARQFEGGLSVQGFVEAITEPVLGPQEDGEAAVDATEESQGGILHAWTMAEITPHLPRMDLDRSPERGRVAFTECLCIRCHRFGGEGGATGPDLSAVGSRFSRQDLLETILEPSKVVSDQYAQVRITFKDRSIQVGRLIQHDQEHIVIMADPYGMSREIHDVSEVLSVEPEPASQMPPGLVNTLTIEQLLDLMSWLETGPEAEHTAPGDPGS